MKLAINRDLQSIPHHKKSDDCNPFSAIYNGIQIWEWFLKKSIHIESYVPKSHYHLPWSIRILTWSEENWSVYYGIVISTEILRRKYCVIYLYVFIYPIVRKTGWIPNTYPCVAHLRSILNKQKLSQDISIITINDTLLLLLFKSLHFSLQPFPATGHHRDLIATAAVSHRRLDVHLDYGLER